MTVLVKRMFANQQIRNLESLQRTSATIDGAWLVPLCLTLLVFCFPHPVSAQSSVSEVHVRQSSNGMMFGKIEPDAAGTVELRGEMTVSMPKPSYSQLDAPGKSTSSQVQRPSVAEVEDEEEEAGSAVLVGKPAPNAKATNKCDAAGLVKLANKPKLTGTADYYADKFHGRKTASGQIHDKTKFTAAHRTLPFGTKLKIVNRSNGKSCIVVVNDRGPFTKSRLIDLSYAAAKEIELISSKTRLVDCFLVEE